MAMIWKNGQLRLALTRLRNLGPTTCNANKYLRGTKHFFKIYLIISQNVLAVFVTWQKWPYKIRGGSKKIFFS